MVQLRGGAFLWPFCTLMASMAYSTWKRRPSGEKVLTPRSYSDRVRNIVYDEGIGIGMDGWMDGCSRDRDRRQTRRRMHAVQTRRRATASTSSQGGQASLAQARDIPTSPFCDWAYFAANLGAWPPWLPPFAFFLLSHTPSLCDTILTNNPASACHGCSGYPNEGRRTTDCDHDRPFSVLTA